MPLRIGGVDADLSQSQAHREPTVEMLEVLQPDVNVPDRDLHIVNDLSDEALDKALFLLLRFVCALTTLSQSAY